MSARKITFYFLNAGKKTGIIKKNLNCYNVNLSLTTPFSRLTFDTSKVALYEFLKQLASSIHH